MKDPPDMDDSTHINDKRDKNRVNRSIKLLKEMINNKHIEIKSEILKRVILELGKIIGNINSKKVLSQLFKNFCIGK